MKKKNKKKISLYFIFILTFTSGTYYEIIKAYVEVLNKLEFSPSYFKREKLVLSLLVMKGIFQNFS